MKTSPKPIHVFKYNPPLKVITNDRNAELESDSFLFAIPKLKRQIAHDRVTRYFQNSGNIRRGRLD
ncbi:MAG TPA: hypothetical protein DIV79_14180 [Opitutae bacterium]|nr:hypothetical protein [Opitutaceae bacterium]HCR31156.1 hypothetical protein [Opitutae bacterium]